MPHGRTSRDRKEFAPQVFDTLRRAAADLRLFLSRGYGMRESLQLVGNHFRLTARQRHFLYRCISPPAKARCRKQKRVTVDAVRGKNLVVDAYNCLIITEYCLAGGVVMQSDDGVLRDIQGLFGAYRMSEHTKPALALLADAVAKAKPQSVFIIFDAKMRHAERVRTL